MRHLIVPLLALAGAIASPPVQARTEHPAVTTVRGLYAAHARAFAAKTRSPIEGGPESRPYFHPGVAKELRTKELSFDPLYDAQDARITELTVRLDPKLKVLRGTAFVRVTFRNFGKPTRLTFYLRRWKDGRWRVFDIEAKTWTLHKVLKNAPPA